MKKDESGKAYLILPEFRSPAWQREAFLGYRLAK